VTSRGPREGSKKMNDEKFIAKWELKHKKGIISYVITDALIYLLIVPFLNFILIRMIPRSQEEVKWQVIYVISFFVLLIIKSTIEWFKNEKRYTKIQNIK